MDEFASIFNHCFSKILGFFPTHHPTTETVNFCVSLCVFLPLHGSIYGGPRDAHLQHGVDLG